MRPVGKRKKMFQRTDHFGQVGRLSSYGSYAHALAEMVRVGGLPLDDVFDRARLRVSDLTKGAEIS